MQIEWDVITKYSPSKNPQRFTNTKLKSDVQQSVRIAWETMLEISGAENPKWAAPQVTHANTGTPLAVLAQG